MKIKTTKFGEIEVLDKNVFKFVCPILGFEDEKEFVLIERAEGPKMKWLQSVKTPGLTFVVTFADNWNIDYSFELPDEAEKKLQITSADDIIALNVVVIPQGKPENSTVNLLAPLILNIKNQTAGQFVLANSNFAVEFPLFLGGKK